MPSTNTMNHPTVIPKHPGIRFILLLLVGFAVSGCHTVPAPVATKGVLNLQNRDWANNGIADLNGEWEFYWHQLYTPSYFDSTPLTPPEYAVVPGFWNDLIPSSGLFDAGFGYATYRLRVTCPPSAEPLQLKFLTVSSAYKLFVNGKEVAQVGKVGKNKATTTAAYQPAIFTVTPVNNRLDIIVQVANFSYTTGGLWDFVKLGTEPQISTYHIRSVSRDFFIAGSFLLIGLFYFVIYFFFRRNLSPVYFALFCLLVGGRTLVTGELGITYFTSWSWQTVKHIVLMYLTVPVLSLFSYLLFPAEFSKKILRYILLVSAPFVAIALFASPLVFRYTLRPFQIFMLLTACYGWYVYVSAVQNKRVGSGYFLVGYGIVFFTIINDILYTSLIIQSTNLTYLGLYVLVICQAATLARQFFLAYNNIERLNHQLEGANEELARKNETIHETNVQLNRLNTDLDTLVFRTSHDLKSPITSVYALTDLIRIEPDAEKRSSYLDLQKKTLMRLNDLIADILHFSKNKSALQFEKINLHEFITDVMEDHLYSDKSGKVQRIVEVVQSVDFSTDKSRLSMVLSNLVSNALKHHNKEGEHPYVKIVARATDGEATIEVKDNGQGISQVHLDHIFTKFYQVNKTKDGSGLGLYIVKEAIEKLGGDIRVESELRVGTTFFITIPNGPAPHG